MKRLLLILLSVVLVFSLSVAAIAADDDEPIVTDEPEPSPLVTDTPDDVVIVSPDVAASHTVGVPAVIEELFGEYQPRTYTIDVIKPDGSSETSTEYVNGVAGVDWIWITAVAVFTVFLYCLMRLVGGIFKWN